MQRQLDDDLRDSEMEVLMNHTRHCPDCAAMFERLTRLSAELTSLPKVTPSYSLVDAIMPELIRIDNEAKQAATASVPTSLSEDQQSFARRSQRARRWPSWKSISGVVAAGIVAGIFLITYPPQSGTSNNDAGNTLNSYSAQMKVPEGAVADDMTPMSANVDAGGDAASDMPVDKENNSQEPSVMLDQNGANSLTITGKSEAFDAEGNAQRNSSNSKSVEDEQKAGSPERSVEGIPNMDIASQALVTSPDGQYVASVDQYSIVIMAASDGSTLFKSDRKNGQHGGLTWSPESSELSYEVSLEHGATQKYVIDIPKLEERKAD